MAWIGFEKLAGALAVMARPLSELYSDSAKKHADKAAAQADGQTKYGPPKKPDEPPGVARAAAVAQIVRIEAEPPLVWLAPRAAWRCDAEETTVSVQLADGSSTRHVYERGTLIPVAAGMVHFPVDRVAGDDA
jgi:hypothetical protein